MFLLFLLTRTLSMNMMEKDEVELGGPVVTEV